LRIPRDNVKITQIRDGYRVQIQNEVRARYIGDLYFLISFNKEVEIAR
jgi:hypothetical protein